MKNGGFVWQVALIGLLLILPQVSSIAAQEKSEVKFYQQGVALFAAGKYKETADSDGSLKQDSVSSGFLMR